MKTSIGNRKVIFVGIAFGASVRDFLRTRAFTALQEKTDVHIVIFSQDLGASLFEEFKADNVSFEKLEKYRANFAERILLAFHRTLLSSKSRTIALGNTGGNTLSISLLAPVITLLRLLLGFAGVTRLIEWGYRATNKGSEFCATFERYNPSLLIITRALNYSNDYPLLKSAAVKNVPCVALVSSWDNLTSKAFFPFSINSLVVWNQVMKEEAVSLYGFDETRILVSGVPRYDIFFNTTEFPSRMDLFDGTPLDKNKKTVLYATGSGATTTSKFDRTSPEADICMFIADAMRKELIDAQLVVRLHPQAKFSDYAKLIECFPEVCVDVPGSIGSFQDRLFSVDDDLKYGAWLKESDVVINFASTASLDAAVFDTPIICVNFDFRGSRPYKYSPRKMYEFDHYSKLLKCNGILLSTDKEQLLEHINLSLKKPQYNFLGRQKIIDQQIHFTDGRAGDRIGRHLVDTLNMTESSCRANASTEI